MDNDTSAYKRSKPRPAFNEMMVRAEEGQFDYIVARHLDRLTRRLEEFAIVKRRVSSAATHAASGVGSMVVAPPSSAYRRDTAACTAAGE